ncbi:phosphatase PAP2 family protein [Candidatus Villigracilis saccharophilus]|uniref:phosphatase PAP2 family protein n=1 Tax=Candidatus Villigracilis saccharophilus TaxID=3140684 RepID=UPI0031357120|nr:phosphatase PAP2 family protein [Anaerolineales bacterium]
MSAPVRKYRAMLFQVTLLLVAGSFAALTFLVKAMPSFAVDLQISQFVQLINNPFFALFMGLISWPGFLPQSIIIAVLTVLLFYKLGLQWESLMVLFAATFSSGVNVLVKDLIQRPRPTAGMVNVISTLTSYSFPSGHVMFYLGYFGFVAFLIFSLLKPSLKRNLLLVLLCSLIILVGPSRIFLGQHWASDVLGAYLLGSLTLAVIIQFYRWGKTRFFVHQPVADATL